MSARMWVETVRELRRSRPEWIFVQADYQRYIDAVPALGDLLSSAYTPMDTPGAGGRWWHTERPGAAAPSPEGTCWDEAP